MPTLQINRLYRYPLLMLIIASRNTKVDNYENIWQWGKDEDASLSSDSGSGSGSGLYRSFFTCINNLFGIGLTVPNNNGLIILYITYAGTVRRRFSDWRREFSRPPASFSRTKRRVGKNAPRLVLEPRVENCCGNVNFSTKNFTRRCNKNYSLRPISRTDTSAYI